MCCISKVSLLTDSMFETDDLVATWGARNCNFSNSHEARLLNFFLALPLGEIFLAFTKLLRKDFNLDFTQSAA